MEIRISGDIEDIADDIDLYSKIISWTCIRLKLQPSSIDVILVDDTTLRELHKIYLDDDSNTDVMTFNLGEDDSIEGEIYISLPRVYEQSQEYNVTYQEELVRILIHACLHLAGYDDLEDDQRMQMKLEEDKLFNEARAEYLATESTEDK